MKNIIILCIFSVFFLSWCWLFGKSEWGEVETIKTPEKTWISNSSNTSESRDEESDIEEFDTSSSLCNSNLEWSSCKDNIETDNLYGIVKISKNLCELQNISPKQYGDIFYNYDERKDIISNAEFSEDDEDIKTLSFTFDESHDWEDNGKDIQIMYDLTYFSGNESIEKDIFSKRISLLQDIIQNGIDDQSIDFGDIITLSYVGTSDYGEASEWKKNFTLSDQDVFTLKTNDNARSGDYTIKYDCDINDRQKTVALYYYSEGNNWLNTDNEWTVTKVSNIQDLSDEITKTVTEKYELDTYNRGTFLLESISKNSNFLSSEWAMNILISDMFFQLHPTMKKNKNIVWPDYDFTLDTIKKLESDTDFNNFYTETIPEYLDEKCSNNDQLYIYWAELSDDLDTKKIMKEYYTNSFFNGCNTVFKS